MGKIWTSNERARSKPCLRCRYSLRNLADQLRCPECGLPVWISLNGNNALGLSDPNWLHTMSIACVGLGSASLGWALLQGFWIERYLWLGRWWSVGSVRLYVAGVSGVLCCGLIAAGFLLLKDEGRAIDRGRAERIYALVGVIIFAFASVVAGICFWRLNFLYDWIFQIVLPVIFATIGNATLLFVANRLHRGDARLPKRIVWWACMSLLLYIVTAVAWVPAVLFHLNEGIRAEAYAGPGLGFVPVLIAHMLLSLFVTLAYFVAARRFLIERREAIRAWHGA